jgi:cytochrome c-type biogenesis protein CcsB
VLSLYEQEVQKSIQTGNWETPEKILDAISRYQKKYSAGIIPSSAGISAELLLNISDIFSRISKYYGLIGFILLLFQFVSLLFDCLKLKLPLVLSTIVIILIFSVHTVGLILRWYVSGHAPLSNGYEALTYVAWATVLAGLIFSVRSPVALSVTSVLSALILFVAHLSWMDPQITNLVPVLKSNWLVIHVATITASYGFLAMCALLGFLNLLLIVFLSEVNKIRIGSLISELTDTIELSMTIGLYLLTIGVFLGAVWANESWGRYWGWDPKETWALITVLVYAFIIHMRMIPGMRSCYSFNLASLLGFSTVIMTYFGVNYYLSGLHSYAKGDPLPVPLFVYYTLAVIAAVAVVAYFKRKHVNSSTI